MTEADSTAERILAQQARRESNARTYPRSLPLAIERARGAILEDVDGNEYVDCLAGAGTLALGHNHPAVVERIERLLERDRPIHTLDLTTPVKERFVDRFGDRIHLVHLHDNDGKTDAHDPLPAFRSIGDDIGAPYNVLEMKSRTDIDRSL